MDDRRAGDAVRAAAVVVTAVAMVVANAVLGSRVGGMSQTGPRSVIGPAVWAFAIWGVIFLLAVALAVYQPLPSNRHRPLMRSTGWWLADLYLLTAVWPWATVEDQHLLGHVILMGMWALMVVVYLRVARAGDLAAGDRWGSSRCRSASTSAGWPPTR